MAEQDKVRLAEPDEGPVESYADLLRKHVVTTERSGVSTEDAAPPRDEKERRRLEREARKRQELEDLEREQEIQEFSKWLTPIIHALGTQTTSRLSPDLPYTEEEARTLAKAVAEVGDKYSDGWLSEYKEEIALVTVALSQMLPRYMYWRSMQPADISHLANASVHHGQKIEG